MLGLPKSQPIDILQFQLKSELIFFCVCVCENFHIDSKMYMEVKKTKDSEINLEKEQVRQLIFVDVKIYYNIIVRKTVWYSCKNVQIEQ